MSKARALLSAAVSYVRKNPDELVKAAVNAASGRFGVPMAALRYLAEQAPTGKRMPKDIELATAPPALRLSATVDAMGTSLRAGGAIKVDHIEVSVDTLRVGVRLNDLKLTVLGESDSPVATLVKSGALDLSKPGNLVKHLPKKPAAIVEAEGDRIVLDLMRVPSIAKNRTVQKVLSVLTPLVGIRGIETDRDHIYVNISATPKGLRQAFDAIRKI
ncbi:MAG: hypothetical protein IPG50_09180 [Myxococcales bacterium]|nr:hypothetical protein [Myxococcales bacterium]